MAIVMIQEEKAFFSYYILILHLELECFTYTISFNLHNNSYRIMLSRFYRLATGGSEALCRDGDGEMMDIFPTNQEVTYFELFLPCKPDAKLFYAKLFLCL